MCVSFIPHVFICLFKYLLSVVYCVFMAAVLHGNQHILRGQSSKYEFCMVILKEMQLQRENILQ